MAPLDRRSLLAAAEATALAGPHRAAAQGTAPGAAVDVATISPLLTESVVRVGEIDFHCVTGGTGPIVLLWHGFLGNWYTWREVLPRLVEDFTVVCPDMRGYGGSITTDAGYDARTLKDDFRGLVQALGHERPHIMAHDMGGPPALLYAADHPGEVLSLSYLEEPVMLPEVIADLIQMTPERTHMGGLWWWMMAQSPSMTETLVGTNPDGYANWFWDNYTMDPATIDERARAHFVADLSRPRGVHGCFGVYRDVFETIRQTAPLADAKVSVPILALGGEGSQGDGVRTMMERVGTDVRGGTVAGAGHFIPEERPDALVSRFAEFVRAL